MLNTFVRALASVLFVAVPVAGVAQTQPQAPSDLGWSQHVVDSTLARYPDAKQFGSWSYRRDQYLFQYLVCKEKLWPWCGSWPLPGLRAAEADRRQAEHMA